MSADSYSADQNRGRLRRTYQLQVAGVPSGDSLGQLKRGIHFAEGKFRVLEAYIVKVRGKSALVEVVLAEGHNRELRRLFARLGHKVMKLKRVAFGPLNLGNLPVGQHRELRRNELAALLGLINPDDSPRAHGGGGRKQPGRKKSGRPPSRGRSRSARPS